MARKGKALGMSVSRTISGQLMDLAHQAYLHCVEDRLSGKCFPTDDNNYSIHAMEVYILSAIALEAFINEVCLSQGMKTISGVQVPLDMLRDLEIKKKYYLVPLILWGQTYDRGRRPYQDFDMLIDIRNDLVHYKMKGHRAGQEPKYFQVLSNRGVLLSLTAVDKVLTSKAALWAYNTACRMAKKLIEMADEQTRKRGQLAIEYNFKEISNDYWKTLVKGRAKSIEPDANK